MRDYPKFREGVQSSIDDFLLSVRKERKTDILEFANLKNIFISGRKVGKIPTGASDISATDRVGDFNYDASYLYICVNNAGSAVWRRAALSSW